ncbi:MAG: zf-HC2 domain-containing protein [Chloroflexota bacterium]|nr:zf-HC2 domain-containing protein [Chloroflexota bacterium]
MIDHKNCRFLIDSLSDYVDGTLDETLCAEIDRHLADCEDCRIVVDSLRKTIYLYHTTAQETGVPQQVRHRLFHRLNLDEFLETGS